ncbi:MAG: hypothetical protein NKF39_02835 [Tropheryma whipplei]|nr:hypothetical protein [Tropheryma whipplei]
MPGTAKIAAFAALASVFVMLTIAQPASARGGLGNISVVAGPGGTYSITATVRMDFDPGKCVIGAINKVFSVDSISTTVGFTLLDKMVKVLKVSIKLTRLINFSSIVLTAIVTGCRGIVSTETPVHPVPIVSSDCSAYDMGHKLGYRCQRR